MLFKVILLGTVIGLTRGFIPTAARLKVADKIFKNNGRSTVTHPDMTKQALLRTAADFFIFNPNPNYQSGSQAVQRLVDSVERAGEKLDISKLIDAYYSNESEGSRKRRKAKLCKSIDTVIEYNAKVDTVREELRIAAAHFDSEQFESAQKRLVDLRSSVQLLILHQSSNRNYEEEYDNARKQMGRLLHTLQDFYSHTNYIENWVDEVQIIHPYNVLGQPGKVIENVAKLENPCLDCTKTGTSMLITMLDLMSFGQVIESTSMYDCIDNLDVSLKSRKELTSGYSQGGKYSSGEEIVKPSGKCSHGGVIDGSTDQSATGGINKDSPHLELASHHYYHGMAADVAQRHSYEFLLSLWIDVHNDQWFSEFLGLGKLITTIAVVIDKTLRTVEHLDKTQRIISKTSADIKQQMPDIIVQYILVPVDDMGVGEVTITEDVRQMEANIAQLNVQNTGHGSVSVLDAIIRAAKSSQQDAVMLVLTDSSEIDRQHLGRAEAVCTEKNVRLIFIQDVSETLRRSLHVKQMYKDKRHRKRENHDDVYDELEMLSDGQIIEIPSNDISKLASFVAFSALGSNTIFRASNAPGSIDHNYSFPVDSYTSQILIFVNGENINVTVLTPQGMSADRIPQYSSSLNTDTSYIATINITEDALYGLWGITIESQGSFTVQVSGNSELIISTRIFSSNPNGGRDIDDTKPLENYIMFVESTIIGSDNPIELHSINVVNDQLGFILSVSNLTENDNNSYIGSFDPPPEEFQLEVKGIDDNGFLFSYISDISVEPINISLTYSEDEAGYVMFRPGENATVSITLMNIGETDVFRINIDTDASADEDEYFEYAFTPSTVSVQQNTTAEITVQIVLYHNAPAGLSITFTLVAQSATDIGVSDYITFDVTSIETDSSGNSANSLLAHKNAVAVLLTSLLLLCNLLCSI